MQVVITMGGLGQRFKDLGHSIPKPFISVGDKPVFQHLVNSFSYDWKYFFVINQHLSELKAEEKLKLLFPDCTVIVCNYSTRGPIDTVLTCLPYLNATKSVLVSYCDYSLIWNPTDFENFVKDHQTDAAIIGYQGFHPTYFGPNSYCHLKISSNQNPKQTSNLDVADVQEVFDIQEKTLFTSNLETEITSCGAYYFKTANFLKECLDEQLNQNLNCKGEFYISLAVKAMMNLQEEERKKQESRQANTLKIHYYPVSHFVQFGTPTDIERYQFWNSVILKKEKPENFKFLYTETENSPLNFSDEMFKKEKNYWSKILLR